MIRHSVILAIEIMLLNLLPSIRAAAGQKDRPAAEEAEETVAAASDRQPISVDVAIVEYLAGEGTETDGVDSLAKTEKWIQSLNDQKALLSLTRVTVSTVDGQQGMTQYGERAAVETARTRVAPRARGGFGGAGNVRDREAVAAALEARNAAMAAPNVAVSYQYNEFGTLVRATPHVADDGIVLDLQVERSALSSLRHPAELDPDGVDQVPPPTIVRLQAESTLRLKGGTTHVAYRKSATSPHGLVETVVLVTAHAE